jgi:hypothetical protein
LRPLADAIESQGVRLQFEAMLRCNPLLSLFNGGVEKLFHAAALQADQVVVVRALVEFENRLAGLEVAPLENARLLELCQDTIDRSQAYILMFSQQLAIDVFRAHVALTTALEYFQNLQTRERGLQSRAFQVSRSRQFGSPFRNCNTFIIQPPIEGADDPTPPKAGSSNNAFHILFACRFARWAACRFNEWIAG